MGFDWQGASRMKIQTQLTVVVAAVVTFVVALAGVLIVMRNDNQATDQVDRLLSGKAAAVRTAAIRSGDLPTDGSYAVRLISAGKVVKQVGTTAQFPIPTSDGYTNVAAAGSEWRSLSETLISGAQMQILVSLTNVREQHTSNVLKVDLLVVLAALLSAAGVWFATGRVLRPFQRLIAAARGLGPGDRLPEVKSPREVAELSTTLNAMLDRVSADPPVPDAALLGADTRELPLHPGVSPDISEMSGAREQAPGPEPQQATRPRERRSEVVSTVERPVDVQVWQPEVARVPGAQQSGAQAGGSQRVGSQQGGSQPGGSQQGGLQQGGSQPDGSQPGGSQQGGSQQSGPQAGGPQAEALDLDGLDLSLRPQLDGLGTNLDALMDNPDMPATQRHLILALMADEHREIVAELDRLRARSEG